MHAPEQPVPQPKRKPQKDAKPLWEQIVEIGQSVPAEEWAKLPADFSRNLDHYLYGSPKCAD